MEHRSVLEKLPTLFRGFLGICVVMVVFHTMMVSRTVDYASGLTISAVEAELYFGAELFDDWSAWQVDKAMVIDSLSHKEADWSSDWLYRDCMLLLRAENTFVVGFPYSSMIVAGQFHLRGEHGQPQYAGAHYGSHFLQAEVGVASRSATNSGDDESWWDESEINQLLAVDGAVEGISKESKYNQYVASEEKHLQRLRTFLFWAYAARHPRAATSRMLLADETPDFTLHYDSE